jgi:hypothetical protein
MLKVSHQSGSLVQCRDLNPELQIYNMSFLTPRSPTILLFWSPYSFLLDQNIVPNNLTSSTPYFSQHLTHPITLLSSAPCFPQHSVFLSSLTSSPPYSLSNLTSLAPYPSQQPVFFSTHSHRHPVLQFSLHSATLTVRR